VLAGCTHIIKSIIAFADRPTQAACLRVCREWHSIAGKSLYHSITLASDRAPHSPKSSAWAVLRGALIGTTDVCLAAAGMTNHYEGCEPGQKCAILRAMGPVNSDRRDSIDDAIDSIKMGGWRARMVSQACVVGDDGYDPRDCLEILALNSLAIDVAVGSVDDKNVHYATNFKRALLRHVRVLTLATHDDCLCAAFGDIIPHLMPDVEVIRIAGNFDHHELHWSMHSMTLQGHLPYKPCCLVTAFNPRKLVFRNVSPTGIQLGSWSLESVTDLVIVLPSTGLDWWMTEGACPALFFRDQLPNVRHLKIVFHDEPEDNPLADGTEGRTPALPEAVILCLQSALPQDVCFSPIDCPCSYPKACDITSTQAKQLSNVDIEVYGLGRVRFANAGLAPALIANAGLSHSLPAGQRPKPPTPRKFLELVKQDVVSRKCITEAILQTEAPAPSEAYVDAVASSIKYLPLSEYMQDESARRYELDRYE
jgi:hypothetical protein